MIYPRQIGYKENKQTKLDVAKLKPKTTSNK